MDRTQFAMMISGLKLQLRRMFWEKAEEKKMSGLFNLDNPVWRFMGKLADLMILHLLWIICSIPIFTIGASTTAVYYVTLKLVRDEEGYTVKSFFKSFKENFKQSTIIWLMILVLGIILGVDLRLYINAMGSGGNIQRIMAILFFSLAVLFIMTLMYVFPLQAKFYNPIKRTLINAFFMSVRHLPYTILMIVITVLFYACVLLIPQMSLFLVVFGITFPAFLNSYFYVKIFDKYIPKEEAGSGTEELSELFADDPMPDNMAAGQEYLEAASQESQIITEEDIASQKAQMAWRGTPDEYQSDETESENGESSDQESQEEWKEESSEDTVLQDEDENTKDI